MLLDVVLCILGTIFVIQSFRRIVSNKSNSIGDYVMLILYLFNCFPILLNLIVGLPKYNIYAWFAQFTRASNNDLVRNVYAIFTLCVIISIKIYLYKHKNLSEAHYEKSKSPLFTGNMLLLVSGLPVFCAILFGHYENYLIFQSALNRGLSASQYQILIIAEYFGLFAFFCWFFEVKKKTKMHSYFLLLVYMFMIMWIDGKRYLIPTIVVLFVFFYTYSLYASHKKICLKVLLIILVAGFAMLYVFYAITYKINVDLSNNMLDTLYLTFRIDFGRDDVTKFVLYKELIEDSCILDYRGQTILSTLLFFVPRFIWPSKPYPHYRYLTAALYNTDVLSIPAGMTPSIFEMSIANCGVIVGMIVTCIFLVVIIKAADKQSSVPMKALYLLLLIGLLTQSMDAMIAIIILAVGNRFFRRITIGGKKYL